MNDPETQETIGKKIKTKTNKTKHQTKQKLLMMSNTGNQGARRGLTFSVFYQTPIVLRI